MNNETGSQNQVQSDAASQHAPQQNAPQGKMFTQDEMNFMTSKVRDQAYERARQELSAQQPVSAPSISKEDVAEIVNAALSQKENNYSAMNVVHKYNEGVTKGRNEYPDFDEVAGIFNVKETPQMVAFVADRPNKHDLMYELGQNPEKFAQIDLLLLRNQPQAAEKVIRKIEASIAENKEAKAKAEKTKEPAPLKNLKAAKSAQSADGSGTAPTTQASMKEALWAIRQKR